MASTAVREERKVVTALFADIVGSTALGERLDPEDVKLVVGDAVARIVGEIEALGGHVKDLAGDGVLAFFGAPTTREDDAERALRAALRIVAEIDDYAREVHRGWGIEGFGVRVGAATGAVVLGQVGAGSRVEYAAFGDTVNTAARLQAAAERGGIVVDEATRRATEALFEWGDAVELALKGKHEPVRAWTVHAARSGARSQRGLPGIETRLVGRSRELARGREALEALGAGRGGVLVVTGDPGIGKSRLLAELRAAAERGGTRWLEGRCVSYGESLPYWPFRDALRGEWIGAGADEAELRVRIGLRRRLDQLFGVDAGELYPYLGTLLDLALEPDAVARIAELSPEALQWRTFEVVGQLLARLAEDAPLVLAIEDLHWADTTSVQLIEQLLGLAEDAAVLLVVSLRPERDHPAWGVREAAAREFPHLVHEIDLGPLGDADGELLTMLVGPGTLPAAVERRVLEAADGNPFFLEEVVRSLADAGALVQTPSGWRYDHEIEIEVPQTVEKVILARIDRLSPQSHDVLTAAAALGRRFALPLLDGVLDGGAGDALHELQRLGLIQQSRRWPQPEFRFRHALIQETAYRTLLGVNRARLHRRAAEWLEERYGARDDEVLGLLAHHWLQAENEDKAIGYLLRAADKARQEYALDEAVEHYRALLGLLGRRGEDQASALVLFKLALALHTSLRFAEANATYRRAFDLWQEPTGSFEAGTTLRMTSSFLPNDADPRSAIAWPNIQLCMQLFDRLVVAWPERTIVPSLAERWEIADDGLRYVFHLRDGVTWSDGVELTAHDVEYGVKRVLDPRRPGSSVAIYFVLEQGEATYLGANADWGAVGVRALDDRTVEFRLAAPAPYFMSVMNRPDGGPQPRHAIEAHGDDWARPDLQVVSGAFRRVHADESRLVLERRPHDARPREGNVRRVEIERLEVRDAVERYRAGEADLVAVRYTPRKADITAVHDDAVFGPAGWSGYFAFDHRREPGSSLAFRRALAHAIDRDALAALLPSNLVVATGGVVPPALQGHTPDIAPRFDPQLARSLYETCGLDRAVRVAAIADWEELMTAVATSWRAALGVDVELVEAPDADLVVKGWLPGYADPEYYLRLLFQSTSRTNEGGFADPDFDELIERARQERSDRGRLERFHEADRYVVADRVAVIPLVYGRSMALVRPGVDGWWEFGKTSAAFADLRIR